jgi:hypothetical protein
VIIYKIQEMMREKQANNPNAPEQSQVVDELQRLSVSGDWGRYPAQAVGWGSSLKLTALSDQSTLDRAIDCLLKHLPVTLGVHAVPCDEVIYLPLPK